MFIELENNLKAINDEVSKLQAAVEHIEEAKSSAKSAADTAIKMQELFGGYLENITKEVNIILKPHKELIKVTYNLAKQIESVDFPTRFEKQEKQIRLLKILLFLSVGLSVFSFTSMILQWLMKYNII